ncbi:unnamed protein product [Vitrella brassicaformis CCMP3155]|uniref:Calpain catalytic domain-containing protein n=1 Tax=Vitrella brassicaformis (strain CCMP3155) TaxID=1169540 RepID=A0A0G4EMS3_VITBC|nr:unnamed protein product [Vitrella brassicaformis CCMP3155]|eukprot:CEL98114.1 unnamed protein product [Vitrella brassicaformis CCMP3155]
MSQVAWYSALDNEGQVMVKLDTDVSQHITMCQRVGKKFDDEFLPAEQSIAKHKTGAAIPSAKEWRRFSDMFSGASLFSPASKTEYSRIYQGHLGDFYFIAALETVALRESLIQALFVRHSEEHGIYGTRWYKNGQWVPIIVDDYVPVGLDDNLLFCRDGNPNVMWPSLLEKAYAKLHTSYEAIGDGGSIEEALMDLTGGVTGRFEVEGVAADRLWVYIFERQESFLFTCLVDAREVARRGVSLVCSCSYAINRAVQHEGICYYQLKCSGIYHTGPFDAVVPYSLITSVAENAARGGFFWITMEDFHLYFKTIVECRLVTQPGIGTVPSKAIYSSTLMAFQGEVTQGACPEFRINVEKVPCQVVLVVSQVDQRMANHKRSKQASMLVRLYERVGPDTWSLICKSNWMPLRDSAVAFEAKRVGEYMALCTLPVNRFYGVTRVHRLILRVYSTEKSISVKALTLTAKTHKWVVPQGELGAVPASFVGYGGGVDMDSGEPGPLDVDPDEGVGVYHSPPAKGPLLRADKRDWCNPGNCCVQ